MALAAFNVRNGCERSRTWSVDYTTGSMTSWQKTHVNEPEKRQSGHNTRQSENISQLIIKVKILTNEEAKIQD